MPKKPEVYGSWLKLDKPAHVIGFLLKSLNNTLRQRIEEALRRKGIELSFAQFAALFSIRSEPGITGAKLARRAMVSAQTMNTALRRLESEGRIERRPHPESRRADSWTVTAEGIELLEQAGAVCVAIFERMLAPLGAAEIAALEDGLRRCISALESEDPAAEGSSAPEPGAARATRTNIKRAARQPEAR